MNRDSLPWLPLVLRVGPREVKAVALVDSGATVNVLPFELGVELGAVWDERKAIRREYGFLPSRLQPLQVQLGSSRNSPSGVNTPQVTSVWMCGCCPSQAAWTLVGSAADGQRVP